MTSVLSYDLGTGGCKAALVADDGSVTATSFVAYPTDYPAPGRHEQRPAQWWDAIVRSTRELTTREDVHEIAAIALSGQSLAMVPIDASGSSLLDSVPIWSDTRGAEDAQGCFTSTDEAAWYLRTGNGFPAGMYTVFKIARFMREEPELAARTAVVLGSKDWINFRLTGRVATDPSYASGSGAYDLRARRYDARMLERLGIPSEWLPPIVDSSAVVGHLLDAAAAELGIPAGIPVVAGGVDNSCMALGAGVAHDGAMYLTLGSSNWISTSTAEPVLDTATRSYVFDHVVPGLYVSALSTFGGGSTLSWLAGVLGRGDDMTALLGEAAHAPVGASGLVCVPTLAGGTVLEGGPAVRGAFMGLDLVHTPGHLARAVLEGIGFSLEAAADALLGERGLPDRVVAVGGGAQDATMLQILADLLGRVVVRPAAEQHSAALGAAALALAGVGVWPSATASPAAPFAPAADGPGSAVTAVRARPERAGDYDAARQRFIVARSAVRDFAATPTLDPTNRTETP